VDQVHLVDIEVRHVLLLREIGACIVTLIALFRHHVAAAQNAVRQEDVDVTLDIERYAGAGVSWIDRDEQADRDAFGLEHFRASVTVLGQLAKALHVNPCELIAQPQLRKSSRSRLVGRDESMSGLERIPDSNRTSR
jgi:hypothetical protein